MSASELKPTDAQVRLRNARTEFGHDFCVIPKSDVYAADDEITALRAEVARLKSGVDVRANAERVAESLFVNGMGDRAQRLVLTVDKPAHRDLGGWCFGAVVDRIESGMRESTGRVVADEPWVEKAEAQLQNMHRHVDDLTNDQIRQAIEAVVGMFPTPREAEEVADAEADAESDDFARKFVANESDDTVARVERLAAKGIGFEMHSSGRYIITRYKGSWWFWTGRGWGFAKDAKQYTFADAVDAAERAAQEADDAS